MADTGLEDFQFKKYREFTIKQSLNSLSFSKPVLSFFTVNVMYIHVGFSICQQNNNDWWNIWN